MSHATSTDALFAGVVRLAQPAKGAGYRVNVDALLLAAFAVRAGHRERLVVDLGAGVGAVSLALDHLGAARAAVWLVEREPACARLASANLDANGLGRRSSVVVADLADGLADVVPELRRAASLVVANPPYFAGGARAAAASSARVAARHGAVGPFLAAADATLASRGRACFVYPAAALADLLEAARAHHLVAKRLRLVHGRRDRPARVALVELRRAKPGGLVVEPPWIETVAGRPAPELAALLRVARAE